MKRAFLLAFVVAVMGMVGTMSLDAAEIKPPRSGAKPPAKATVADPAKPAPAEAVPAGEKKTETAIFAGGCFWCTEFAFEQLAGVLDVESGYCGGTKATANYEDVHHGTTAHAEAIRITYNPEKITYEELLSVFFDAHNPTQLNQQGENDIGRQYRSAIFYANDEQQKLAKAKIADLEAKRVYKKKIQTKLEPLKEFYPAEDYHQDFARRNLTLPYIQGHAVPKAFDVQAKHPKLIRNGE